MLVGGVKVAQIKELEPPLAHLFAKKGKTIRMTSYELQETSGVSEKTPPPPTLVARSF